LRGFEKLRTLRCSWTVIVGEEPEGSDDDEALLEGQFHSKESHVDKCLNNLAYRLPSSLEALHVDMDPDDEHWEAFVQMIRESRTSLPNLKRVHVLNRYKKPVPDLLEALDKRGIVYDTQGDFAHETYAPLERLLDGQGVE
jgi:hypothetical protein